MKSTINFIKHECNGEIIVILSSEIVRSDFEFKQIEAKEKIFKCKPVDLNSSEAIPLQANKLTQKKKIDLACVLT